MTAFLLPLMCGYFLNGGIGTMMQPSAGQGGSGPTPSILTDDAGTNILTDDSGTNTLVAG